MNKTAAYWKQTLQLEQHIEGGAYRRTYCSSLIVSRDALPPAFSGPGHLSSAIFFLLEYGDFSAFHRLRSDEMWHFYQGDTLIIYEINKAGDLITHKLGPNFEQGEVFQLLIPAGSWFGSKVEKQGGFALVGCTVTPAFDFVDFELADRDKLTAAWPRHADLIQSMTRLK